MELESLISHMNFDVTEHAVMLALVRDRIAVPAQIARATGIPRTTVYSVIDRLVTKKSLCKS